MSTPPLGPRRAQIPTIGTIAGPVLTATSNIAAMPSLKAGLDFDLYFRDPYNYHRQMNDAGESQIVWTQKYMFKKRFQPVPFMRNHFSQFDWKIRCVGNWTAHELDYTCDPEKPLAVYPSWDASKRNWAELLDYIENPWGKRESAVESKTLKWFEKPIWNQPHRVFIPELKPASDIAVISKLRDIQMAHPEVELFISGIQNFQTIFGMNFTAGDFNPREGSFNGSVVLPNGSRISDRDYEHHRKLISAMGYDHWNLQEDACLFNIESARYAAHHWYDETGLAKNKGKSRIIDTGNPTAFAQRMVADRKSGFPESLVKESDKILCDSCSLWRKCISFRKGSVCNLSGTHSKKLSEMALSRDAGVITDMLASIVSKQAERAEKALVQEQFTSESDGLDPQIDKMLNSVFKNGVALAKLRDPNLGKPLVQINNINGSSPNQIVSGADPRTLVAGIVQQLEAKGIAREDVTEDMISDALRNQELEEQKAIEAEVVDEDDFPA